MIRHYSYEIAQTDGDGTLHVISGTADGEIADGSFALNAIRDCARQLTGDRCDGHHCRGPFTIRRILIELVED